MAKVIAISNHKGGVGKTTSTINLGAALNQLKKKVLLIDLDPQANLSQSLDIMDSEYNIYGALSADYPLSPVEISKNFFAVPAITDLAGIEIELISKIDREFYLDGLLEPVKDSFDYILIDCPPSLGNLTVNAFTAADEIIIPLQSEYLATQGLQKLTEIIGKMRNRLNPKLILGGVFLTLYDNRKILNRDVLQTIEQYFEKEIFKTKIRDNVALAEAPAHGQDIFRYNPKSFGAEDYKSLAKEIIKRHAR